MANLTTAQRRLYDGMRKWDVIILDVVPLPDGTEQQAAAHFWTGDREQIRCAVLPLLRAGLLVVLEEEPTRWGIRRYLRKA